MCLHGSGSHPDRPNSMLRKKDKDKKKHLILLASKGPLCELGGMEVLMSQSREPDKSEDMNLHSAHSPDGVSAPKLSTHFSADSFRSLEM